MNPLLSFIFGAAAKVVAGMIGKWLEMKKAKELMRDRATIEQIKAFQGGEDTLSEGGKWARRLFAFELITTWCWIMIYHVLNPDITYTILIPRTPGLLFSWIFGAADQGVVNLSAGYLLWMNFNVIAMISGFYFTKVEKGG